MHLLGVRAFHPTTPASTKSGLRPIAATDRPNLWGGEVPQINASMLPGMSLVRADWQLHVVELEDREPRALFVRTGSNLADMTSDEVAALHHIAGTGQLTSWDEVPGLVEAIKWRERRRPTDPAVEQRAAQLRTEIAALQDELATTEQLLADQASGEFDRRAAEAAERAAADRARIAEQFRAAEERRFQRERARRAGKQVLEQLGAAALGLELEPAAGQVDWAQVERRKAELLKKAKSA